MSTLKKAILARDIKLVWHFTRLRHLDSILEEGLIPRQELENRAAPPVFNDEHRIDGHRDATCCSIGHPNYKMFYSLRQQHEDEEWVVLAISPKILWEKDCAFCVENAASNNVTAVQVEDRKGVHGFNKLFDEYDGKPSREELGITEKCPTHPQAEILVFDRIEPEFIVGAVFQTQQRADEYNEQYDDFQCISRRAHFNPRCDYEHWR